MMRRCLLPGMIAALALCGCGEMDDDSPDEQMEALSGATAKLPKYNLSVPRLSVAHRVRPGGTLEVTITARNSGRAVWQPLLVKLVFQGDPSFEDTNIPLSSFVRPGELATFHGEIEAPRETGRYPLSWRAHYLKLPFGPEIRGTTQVAKR